MTFDEKLGLVAASGVISVGVSMVAAAWSSNPEVFLRGLCGGMGASIILFGAVIIYELLVEPKK